MASAINESTLKVWMARFGPGLINLSAGICRDRHQAEEIVQEAFVKLWKSPPDVGEVAYASWLRKVVTNLSINALKRTRRPGSLPEFDTDETSSLSRRASTTPSADCETRDEIAVLHEAMNRLDDTKRAILILRAQENLSYEAIAEHLCVPLGTVMSRLNRARASLIEEMEQVRAMKRADSFDIRRYRQA